MWLRERGFEPIAPYFQFRLPTKFNELEKPIKIDLLAAPIAQAQRPLVKINKPRIKPRAAQEIHGFLTEEAVTLEEHLLPLNISETGEPLTIYLPHPFTALVMKLFALRDRLNDETKGLGSYHAFDIYRIAAMMTEQEWQQAVSLRDRYLNVVTCNANHLRLQ